MRKGFLLAIAGAIGGLLLLTKKKASGGTLTVQIHVPTAGATPAGTVTITQPATAALPGLSVDETVSIESDSKDDLYRKAMISTNKNYVGAAATFLCNARRYASD